MARRVVPLGIPFVRKAAPSPVLPGASGDSTNSDVFDAELSEGFLETLRTHKVSARRFLAYCAMLTAVLALLPALTPTVAEALAATKRPRVVWRPRIAGRRIQRTSETAAG